MPVGQFVDTCEDGIRVGTVAGVNSMFFDNPSGSGLVTVPLAEPGLYVRAAAFANDHLGLCIGGTSDTALLVRLSDGAIINLGTAVGPRSVAMRPNVDFSQLHVAIVASGTHWRHVIYNRGMTVVSDTMVPLPPAMVGTSQGLLDVEPNGIPVFTDERIPWKVDNQELLFPVERTGVWFGQRTPTPPDELLEVRFGIVTPLYVGLALEPHATLSLNQQTIYISFRTTVMQPDGTFGLFLQVNAGRTIGLKPPLPDPIVDAATGDRSTKSWAAFFNRAAGMVTAPVSASSVHGVLPPAAIPPWPFPTPVPPGLKWTEFTTTLTGTVGALDFNNADLLRCNNAALLTIAGLVTGIAAQRLVIMAIGAAPVQILHESGSATAPTNRIITRDAGVITLTPGTPGYIAFLERDGATGRWRTILPESATGSFAPADAEYLVRVAHAGLSAERVVRDTPTVAWNFPAGFAEANVNASAVGGHVHGLFRTLGDGATTAFNLPDLAEYLEHVGVNGAFSDPATAFSLSADRTQIVFAAAPGAGQVITVEYVIAM